MRLLLFIGLGAISALAQPFSFGVRAGVPVTEFFRGTGTATFPYTSTTNRYLIGPTAELRLPFGLGLEFDALYRHFSYASPGLTPNPSNQLSGLEQVSGSAWEFPLMAKYRFPSKVVRPYVDAGIAWNKISGLDVLYCFINCFTAGEPPSLRDSSVTGFVAGAGLDIHLLFLHVSPEVRYTHWGAEQFRSPNGGFSSDQNEVEVLLGITR
jgi:opacity protein-like surface antigen